MISKVMSRIRVIRYRLMKNIQIDLNASIGSNCEIKAFRGSISLNNSIIRSGGKIVTNGGKIVFGRNVFINHNFVMYCHESINIGSNVQIGPNVVIYDHDHTFCNEYIDKDKFTKQPVNIKDNTWIGANVTILKGVTIGEHCVIGAGSLITHSIPSGSIVYDKRNQIINKIAGGK